MIHNIAHLTEKILEKQRGKEEKQFQHFMMQRATSQKSLARNQSNLS
jgi:hypothetical protein